MSKHQTTLANNHGINASLYTPDLFTIKSYIKNRQDIWPIAVVIGFILYQLIIFLYAPNWQLALGLIIIPQIIFSVPIASAMHISVHTPIFYSKSLEFIFGILFALENGITRHCFILDHLTHHQYYLDQKKDPNAWQQEGKKIGRLQYTLHNLVYLYPRSWSLCKERSLKIKILFITEIVVCMIIIIALASINIMNALAIYGSSIVLGIFSIYYWAHHQHSGLESTNPCLSSRSYLGNFYNWIGFNVGYHAAHHIRPGIHWSKLPSYHNEIAQHIPEELLIHYIPVFGNQYSTPHKPHV